MKAFFKFCILLIPIIALIGCSNGGNSPKSPSPSPQAQTLLGSFQANVSLDPPSISIEPINSSGLKNQGLADTDFINIKFPFQIRGSMSFAITTATISVTMTNTSSLATLNEVDVRIRSITDLGITISGDTPPKLVPGGIVPEVISYWGQ
jgi:hypothetical protein